MKRVWKIILSLAIVFSISVVTLLAGCTATGDSYINITADESSTGSESGTDSESSSGSSDSSEVTDNTSSSNTTGDSGNSSSDTPSNTITSLTASGLNVEYEVATSSSDTYSVAENLLSVITVYSDTTRKYSSSGMMMPGSSSSFTYHDVYTGSGVIFSIEDDYVYFVTCYHVVYNEDEEQVADEIYVYLYGSVDGSEATSTKTVGSSTYYTEVEYGGDAITCEYVGGSWAEDVAVLRADKQDVLDVNDSVRAVTFAEDYSVGDDAVAIGNYAGAGISVTKGSVAVDSETIDLTLGSTTNEFRVMRLDIEIFSGNSGGGLFNADGYYIGMVDAMCTYFKETSTTSAVYYDYGYAIPASTVIKSIENIIYYYTDTNEYDMYTADLGLTVKVAGSVYVYDETTDTGCIKEEVAIASVTTDSAAESMGLETGDIITSITVDGTEYAVTRTFVVEEIGLIIFEDSVVTISYTRSGTAYTTSEYTVTTDCIVSH